MRRMVRTPARVLGRRHTPRHPAHRYVAAPKGPFELAVSGARRAFPANFVHDAHVSAASFVHAPAKHQYEFPEGPNFSHGSFRHRRHRHRRRRRSTDRRPPLDPGGLPGQTGRTGPRPPPAILPGTRRHISIRWRERLRPLPNRMRPKTPGAVEPVNAIVKEVRDVHIARRPIDPNPIGRMELPGAEASLTKGGGATADVVKCIAGPKPLVEIRLHMPPGKPCIRCPAADSRLPRAPLHPRLRRLWTPAVFARRRRTSPSSVQRLKAHPTEALECGFRTPFSTAVPAVTFVAAVVSGVGGAAARAAAAVESMIAARAQSAPRPTESDLRSPTDISPPPMQWRTLHGHDR